MPASGACRPSCTATAGPLTRPRSGIGERRIIPGPTLNLQRTEHQSCHGIAFEFADHQRRALTNLLTEREGCTPIDLTIRLDNGAKVVASVNVYAGRNIIKSKTIDGIVSMILKARGEKGSCVCYVKGIAEKLHEMGIEDPVVSATWQAAQRAHGTVCDLTAE
jgi:cation transport regulator ChaC